jgi:PAS domain S-box-containing protein
MGRWALHARQLGARAEVAEQGSAGLESTTLKLICVAGIAARVGLVSLLLACSGFALNPSLDLSQYAHNAWRVRDGFGKGFFLSIAQTPDGYLWLGTDSGLLQFDGVRPVSWQPPGGQQLPAIDIPTLLVTRDGALWIGTAKGLARWKDGKLITWAELSGQRISSLLQDRAGVVWIGSRAGTSAGKLCAFQDEKIQCDGAFEKAVRSLYEDSQGNLLVGVNDGLWKWKPGRSAFFALPEEHLDGSIGEDNQSAILIGTQLGIHRLLNGRVEPYILPGIRQTFRASRILRDHDGGLWIATRDRGLLHYHQGKTDAFSEADGLSGDSVAAIFQDREDNVWAATSNGLDRFRDYAVPKIGSKQGLSNTVIESLLATKDGSVWIATFNGLNKWKSGRISVFGRGGGTPQRGETLNELTHSLFQDSSGRMWVSTSRETGYLEEERFVPVFDSRASWVYSIAEAPSGHLWLANDQEGLFHLFEGTVVQNIPWSALGHKDYARVLLADPSHGLWLGLAQGGVLYFADGRIERSYSAAEGLGRGMVNGLQVGAGGVLWAATEGGLSRIRDGHITTLTSKNGLPCETVHWSMEDDDRSLWLYMACGLVRIARPELDAWVSDPARSVTATLFDASDGVRIPSYSSQLYSVTKSSDGRIWFAAFDGVSVIDPRHLAYNNLPPPVHIQQILADGKKYDIARGANLPPLVRNIVIDFIALSLTAPEKNRYRFKLEGWDPDWRDTLNEYRLEYSNLPPRHYRFRVIACNNSGLWNETGDTLEFSIAPAYYQTYWFFAACIASFAGVLLAAYQFRTWHLQRDVKKLRSVIETIPAMAWTALPDGSNEFVNLRWAEYTGLSAEKTAGSGWTAAVHPDDRQPYSDKWRRSVTTGEPLETEGRFRCSATGEYRWFHARGVPLRDKNGKIRRWYGILTDIEDRKRAEEEREKLRQLEADLAHINRVSMMGELAASVAHEVNQPLTGIVSNGSACLRFLAGDAPDVEEAREAVRDIVRDGKRAGEVIARIRALTKKAAPPREKLDVNDTIREVLSLVGDEAKSKSVAIRAQLAQDLSPVLGDRVQLQQVVLNLAMNAMEAMSGVSERARELVITTRNIESDQLEVTVKDSGIGLDPNTMSRIFEPFYTTKSSGMGMGLSISRSIVQHHGGRLWATLNDGPGTSFHFTLPKCQGEEHHAGGAAV